jgi:hypothetical protein
MDKEYFRVTTDASGTTYIKETGALKYTITNVVTGESILVNASGPGTVILYANGDVVYDIQGQWLWAFPSSDQASALGLPELSLLSGHNRLFFPASGAPHSELKGHVSDLCAQIT